ncbi:MAG: sulfite exporter TauE/SafE family protein [Ruminococcaceae bacterium]|nr:sulfite exporter TauE/SafE family protein [Oscillospiraceae bacterium]
MIAAILSGAFAGVISGMGIGGGTILIPALLFFTKVSQHEAQGINLLFFIPTAIISLWIHFRNKSVAVKVGWPVIISGVFGSVFGAMLAGTLSGGLLRKLFGGFLLVMGLYEIFKKDKNSKKEGEK